MRNRLLYIVLGCVLAAGLFAQEGSITPIGVLEYYSDEYEIKVFDSDGIEISEVFFGMELAEGDRITTGNSNAELRLDPNGTIIKLSYDTDFSIETFQRDEGSANQFTLFTGKLRTIAAKTGLMKNNYSIQTPSAVCGVRGTDFGLQTMEGITDSAFVLEGVVEFTSLVDGKTLELTAGTTANIFDPVFEVVDLTSDQLDMLFSDLQFETLNPADVPGHILADASQNPEETSEEPVMEEEPPVEEPIVEEEPVPTVPETPPAIVEEPSDTKTEVQTEENGFTQWLRNSMGMEIGTLTINGITYSKAILQPTLSIGKLRAGLYLPVIYTTNMFDSDDWYKPGGNSEWSFGTDQDGAADIAKDAFQDLILKLKYIEYGGQRDPFYIKAGNLSTMTIGHGIIMQNYANDIDFPAVRKIGLNMGVNGSAMGMEFVGDDLSDLAITGGRIAVKPASKLGIGMTAVMDMTPEMGLEETYELINEQLGTSVRYGDSGAPIFIAGGFDADLSILETEMLSLVLFSDIAGMVPYYRTPVVGYPEIEKGLAIEALYDKSESEFSDKFRNWGMMTGILGKLLLFDYRLEYRHFNGIFRAPFFGPAYERMKGGYVMDTNDYLSEVYSGGPISQEYTMTTRGIYGQGGFTFFNLLYLEAGYFLPWNEDGFADEDEFHLLVSMPKGTIPFIDVAASLSYDKIYFVDGLKDGKLVDEYTVIRGEIVYPIAPTLDLAGIVTTNMSIDEDDPEKVNVNPVISIETRIHF